MMNDHKYLRLNLLCTMGGILALLLSSNAYSAQPVINGNFESGNLNGWSIVSDNEAKVLIVEKGSCFSANDTSKINIRGKYSALLRANNKGDENSTAILRSSAFNAGDGFAFIAVSESIKALKDKEPTKLIVEVLEASSETVLVSQIFSTGQAILNRGCPSNGVQGHFSAHYFSTKAFQGQGIKIQFKQSTRIKGSAFFTLIDQVVLFNQGEQPSFHSRPHAQAGMQLTSFGTPMLSSQGSFDTDQKLFDLAYSWYVDDTIFELANPCIENLDNGNHSAILYVNDGRHAISDTVSFFINQLENDIPKSSDGAANDDANDDSDNNEDSDEQDTEVVSIAVSDPECDIQVAPVGDASNYIVAVNDPDNLYVNTAEKAIVDNLTTPAETRTELTPASKALNTFNLQASGIVWIPTSEEDGNLVILTPADRPQQDVSLLDSNGSTLEVASSVGKTDDGRETYRFSRSGTAYNINTILRVGNTNYLVLAPSERVN